MAGPRLFKLRRAVFLARRSVPLVARPLSLLVRAGAPERPVLLIGCPRSGTSALLQVLLRSPELRTVQLEGHILWDAFHPKSKREDDSLGAGDVSARERAYVHLAIRMFARGRFVDKTPENCLRVPYLDELLPDATFVHLHRSAAENVNSLMEGWRARPRFVTHRLPQPLEGIAPLDGTLWSFALIPGWRALRQAPLEEICARQYVACNEAVLAARSSMEPDRWVDVRYDDLVHTPVEEVRRLLARLDVAFTPGVERYASELHRRPSGTTLTPPEPQKWRRQNAAAIERVLPLVAETERRLAAL